MSSPEDDRHEAMVCMVPDAVLGQPSTAESIPSSAISGFKGGKNSVIQQFMLEVGNKKPLPRIFFFFFLLVSLLFYVYGVI